MRECEGGAKQRASNFVVVKVAALVLQFLFFIFFDVLDCSVGPRVTAVEKGRGQR